MMSTWSTAAIVVTFTFLSFSASAWAEDKRADAILKQIDDLWRADASYSKLTMHVKTKNYERSLKMEGWSKGKDKSLIRILSPKKEKGTATLMVDKNIYSYLPKTDRTIRLTSGMMGGSWMGSHFSNDDLVKESRYADDYTFKVTFEGQRGGKETIELTLTPKEDAAVSWGRVVMEVEATTFTPIATKYYDEDGKAARTMTFSNVKVMGARHVPMTMKMTVADKPGEFTEMKYETLDFDAKVKDSMFSKNRLKR